MDPEPPKRQYTRRAKLEAKDDGDLLVSSNQINISDDDDDHGHDNNYRDDHEDDDDHDDDGG